MANTDFARASIGTLAAHAIGVQRVTPRTPAELEAILESVSKAVERVNGQGRVLASAIARTSGVNQVSVGDDSEAPCHPAGLIPHIAALCDDLHRAIDQMQSPIDHASKL